MKQVNRHNPEKMLTLGAPIVRVAVLVVMAACVTTGQVRDSDVEPFGFHKNMTQKQVVGLVGTGAVDTEHSKGDRLVLRTAIHPHPDFESYSLWFSPSEGLLKIAAAGKNIETNGYGEEIKDAFENTEEALAEKYGAPQLLDFLKSGSIWSEPREWTIGLLKKERDLSAVWGWSNDSKSGIALEAIMLSQDEGYIELSYEFSGWNKYVESKQTNANKVF